MNPTLIMEPNFLQTICAQYVWRSREVFCHPDGGHG
jgi:hypothetical protein